MPINRDEPRMLAHTEAKMIILRTRNRQLSLIKSGDGQGGNILHITIVRARPWEDDEKLAADEKGVTVKKKVDVWIRGKSKFNISVTSLAISENTFGDILGMLTAYMQAFPPPPPPPKLNLVSPHGF